MAGENGAITYPIFPMRMKRILVIVLFLLHYGCAQIVSPTGGSKDVTPPEILNEDPSNLSTDFASEKVVISFDEFIKLNNPTEQVIISPPMLKQPSYSLRRKSLVVKFEQELEPNTTYTINFGEAIQDNNEGNVLKNYTYVFSTGSALDSMQVRGKLVDALTAEPIEDALAMLYKQNIDSLPLDTIPNYFTRTGKDGTFTIDHIADQPYKIFALKDQNSNYRFDIPDEQIGFLDSLVQPDPPMAPAVLDSVASDSLDKKGTELRKKEREFYKIKLFEEEDTTQFLKRAYCEHYGKLVFAYNRPVGQFNAEIDGLTFKKQWALKEYSTSRDTVVLWTTDVVPDTMVIHFQIDSEPSDTVELVMKEREKKTGASKTRKGMRKRSAVFALSLKTDPANRSCPKPQESLSFIWSHPIVNMDMQRVSLREDSIRVKYQLSTKDTALRRFELSYPWKKDARYNIHISDSAFQDLFGLWNDTIEHSFIGTDKEMLGELSLNITEQPEDALVIQLLNQSGAILETKMVASKGVVMFSQLNPGKYGIRVVVDKNGNGKWDSGRYLFHLQPEPIRSVKQDAEVRANWNMELEWNPNKTPTK